MDARVFESALDEWIAVFRSEALHQFHAGCAPTDVLKIAMQIADSRQNRRAMERKQLIDLPASPARA
jgi:hypothetical protein